jgi:hypothetical protein
MKTITMLALGLALLGTSTVTFAATKKHSPTAPQAHHCQLNGAEVQKSKKACAKAGGKWEKGAPTTAAAPAPAEAK